MSQTRAHRAAQDELVEAAARDLRGGDPTDADRSDVTRVLAFLHDRGLLRDVEPTPGDQSWLETESSRARPSRMGGILQAGLQRAFAASGGDLKRAVEESCPYSDRRTP